MKILITGGSGFIGAHLAKWCANENHEVHICDNNSRGKNDEFITDLVENKQVVVKVLDLTNKEDVNSLPRDYDVVFHLAAINGTENFYKIPYTVMEVAIQSTANLLSHFKGTKVKFVFSSSSEAYAGSIKMDPKLIPTAEDVPCTIDDVLNERFSYGGSKLACEIMINSFHKQYGLDYQIIRYHNIYGPRMGTKHVMPQFIKRAKDQENPFSIFGSTQTRAFCYVDDAVRVTLELGLSPQQGIFHIGNEREEVDILSVAKMVNEWYDNDIVYLIKEAPQGSVQRRCPDTSKLRRTLGYSPEISLREGLRRTLEWYNEWYETNDTDGLL
jgi:nucleoside-diphosphate-sugar epimerase